MFSRKSTSDDDASSATFTTASGELTPTGTAASSPLDLLDADPMTDASSIAPTLDSTEVVPWPGKSYLILQRGTTHAITLVNGKLQMQDAIDFVGSVDNRWQCVENGHGYFGFYNGHAMTYLGHDNKGNAVASAKKLQGWELITPRRHPEGGYQLLSPHWAEELHSINVVDSTGALVRSAHGNTLWEFQVV
jgi:hypothetical protein